jgi:hypothetical protein
MLMNFNVLMLNDLLCTFRDHQISHCIVIKHLLPHGHNVEENGDCGEEIPAKRPTRNLKVW